MAHYTGQSDSFELERFKEVNKGLTCSTATVGHHRRTVHVSRLESTTCVYIVEREGLTVKSKVGLASVVDREMGTEMCHVASYLQTACSEHNITLHLQAQLSAQTPLKRHTHTHTQSSSFHTTCPSALLPLKPLSDVCTTPYKGCLCCHCKMIPKMISPPGNNRGDNGVLIHITSKGLYETQSQTTQLGIVVIYERLYP